MPAPKEERVVEPKGLTVSREVPEVDVMLKGLTLEEPVRVSLALGVVVPMHTFAPLVMYKAAVPAAVTDKGFKEDPLAVVILIKVPVPVLLEVSAKLNKFLLPVLLLQVKVEVVEAIVKDKSPVGSKSE